MAAHRRTRWNVLPLKCRGFPIFPVPFSPDRKARRMRRLSQIVATGVSGKSVSQQISWGRELDAAWSIAAASAYGEVLQGIS